MADLRPVTVASACDGSVRHASFVRATFVAENAGAVVGFAYSGTLNDRAAYDTSARLRSIARAK
jgi:L-amino acid N-acyltransferase YncA